MKYLILIFALLNAVLFTGATQPIKNPVHWTYTAYLKSPLIVELRFQGRIDNGWHVYSSNNTEENSPMPASLTLNQFKICQPVGKLKSIGAQKYYNSILEEENELFRNQAVFVQTVKLLKPTNFVSGVIKYQAYSDEEKVVIARELPFRMALK